MPALPSHIRLGRALTGELAEAERREWWLANGRGAYAAGTVAGSLTRRYHGLLIAPVSPPLGRHLVFAKADAALILNGREWPLCTNRWAGGAVDPRGYLHLESFHLHGRLPVWRFTIGDLYLEMRIWLARGTDTVYVAYRLEGPVERGVPPPEVRVGLLVNARNHHSVTTPGTLAPRVVRDMDAMCVAFPDRFDLHLRAFGGVLEEGLAWVEGFDLPRERDRGLEDTDSHLRVGYARLELLPRRWVGIAAGLDPSAIRPVDDALSEAMAIEARVLSAARRTVPVMKRAPGWVDQLLLAADSFVFSRPLADLPEGESVIAGYPWFDDWGRDTMIALPGLTLATGRTDSARRILLSYCRFVDAGMLPNTFPGGGDVPQYNTVDAALWFIEAWRGYMQATGDWDGAAQAFPVLESVVRSYRQGTRYGIHMDPADGLIWAGEPGVQLTWMDAKVGDWVVTPRIGKAVEINALWVNALKAMAYLADGLGAEATTYGALAAAARRGFARFEREDGHGLYDLIDGPEGVDAAVRPNQIFAVSLPYSPLDRDAQIRVVRVCGEKLLTSYGLRTLSADHADYRPRYHGDICQRDGAYHQGTVWAWLLGHYALAEYRVTGDISMAQGRLVALADHLLDAGLGTVSEVFDGDPPHRPGGTPSQAWSVACTLEAWWRLQLARGEVVVDATGH